MQKRHTAPSSYNWQDITIYVFTADGVWTYLHREHALKPVKKGDHRKLAGLQSFVWTAPLSFVYVSDQSKMQQGDETFSSDYTVITSSRSGALMPAIFHKTSTCSARQKGWVPLRAPQLMRKRSVKHSSCLLMKSSC